MRARRGRLPKDDKDWGFEIWWAGARALLFGEGGRVTVQAEDGSDLTDRYTALNRLGRARPDLWTNIVTGLQSEKPAVREAPWHRREGHC